MKITYDKEVDAVYIYLDPGLEMKSAWVKKTYPCDPQEVNSMINLDFDEDGKLGGVEIIDASKKLPEAFLKEAENIG
jgi:uncharacterized protein YuzE